MTYYKCLTAQGRAPYSNRKWHLPVLLPDGTYKPGRWMPRITKPLERCKTGYHGCKREQLIRWLDATIYEMEYDGEPESDDQKCWGARARLIRPLAAWNERTARLLACRIAEDVLPLFEQRYPNDDRPRRAIETARRFADGQATAEDLNAAYVAAHAAAYVAAYVAAHAAAHAAADAKYNSWLWEALEGEK